MGICRMVHYTLDDAPATATAVRPLHPCQWVNLDVRTLDPAVFGTFGVLMADPPWFIHQKVSLLADLLCWDRTGVVAAAAGPPPPGDLTVPCFHDPLDLRSLH